jgi:hypothetical protein
MLGFYFFNYDKSILYHIEARIGADHWLVGRLEGIKQSKELWKSSRFNGFELFPTLEAAMESLAVAR